ncbi:hypothetical protein CANARDRAFT_150395 [[Candida] arabinofermentans NRRL YB-2248]|uniref:Proteasome assembly chaperone 3 n=1 Tax=[Candida] arabinofermentans NRRL YB-2248 TaxID=983967 RepID=A0A1E4T2X8_9ASCO|nr:hypothetical protein CANARDRAFT_150395 [[Candida] arabinofermentans NRRL YB-2248]
MSEDSKVYETGYTKTIVTTVTPLFSDPFQLVLVVPIQKPIKGERNLVPITIHISLTGSDAPIGCYVYSVMDIRRKDAQIYQTLLNNAEETLVDLGKRFGQLVCKKFYAPCYVSLSGDLQVGNFMDYIREVFGLIEKQYEQA